MCIPLLNPNSKVETIKKPDPVLPVPPATPDSRVLGDGSARKAALQLKGRQRQIDEAVDAASR